MRTATVVTAAAALAVGEGVTVPRSKGPQIRYITAAEVQARHAHRVRTGHKAQRRARRFGYGCKFSKRDQKDSRDFARRFQRGELC
jgi:hypothetical protein